MPATPLAAPVKRVVRARDVVLTDVAPEIADEAAVMIDLGDGMQFSVRRCTEVRVSGLLHQAADGEALLTSSRSTPGRIGSSFISQPKRA